MSQKIIDQLVQLVEYGSERTWNKYVKRTRQRLRRSLKVGKFNL